jgi:hypothetical protein
VSEDYKVMAISMYRSDVDQLHDKVLELKRRGFRKASMSHLIRIALSQLSVERAAELMGVP